MSLNYERKYFAGTDTKSLRETTSDKEDLAGVMGDIKRDFVDSPENPVSADTGGEAPVMEYEADAEASSPAPREPGRVSGNADTDSGIEYAPPGGDTRDTPAEPSGDTVVLPGAITITSGAVKTGAEVSKLMVECGGTFNVESAGTVVVLGDMAGSITARDIRVAKDARVKGDVAADGDIRCEGVMIGEKTCRTITVTGTGRAKGDIHCGGVATFEGDFIQDGNVAAESVDASGRGAGARLKGTLTFNDDIDEGVFDE